MRKMILFLSAIITITTIVMMPSCKNSPASTGTLLKFNLEKGKTYDYEIAWDMDQKVMDKDNKINLLAGYSFEVTEDQNSIKTLKGVYKNFRLYMKIMELEMDIDTDKPIDSMSEGNINENPMGMMKKIFGSIKGKEFTMKVDEEGNIISVTGFDEIINSIINSSAIDAEMKLQMRASLSDQFNEQELKNQFAQIFMIFPKIEIKPGDSWQKNYRMGGRIPATFSTTYTVKQIDGDHVTLDAKTDIGSAGGEMEVKGSQTGTLLVDSKTGLVINAEFNQDMETKMEGMDITIQGKGKIKGKAR